MANSGRSCCFLIWMCFAGFVVSNSSSGGFSVDKKSEEPSDWLARIMAEIAASSKNDWYELLNPSAVPSLRIYNPTTGRIQCEITRDTEVLLPGCIRFSLVPAQKNRSLVIFPANGLHRSCTGFSTPDDELDRFYDGEFENSTVHDFLDCSPILHDGPREYYIMFNTAVRVNNASHAETLAHMIWWKTQYGEETIKSDNPLVSHAEACRNFCRIYPRCTACTTRYISLKDETDLGVRCRLYGLRSNSSFPELGLSFVRAPSSVSYILN